jgi:hypothetical protein
LSASLGEQEQSKRVRRRRGIRVVLALGKVWFLIGYAKPVFVLSLV